MSSGRALAGNPHYRRLFAARTISNIGNGIFPIALSFGILALPGATPNSLSLVLAAQAIPIVLLLPFGGVIADRVGSAKIIGITDVMMSVVVAFIAFTFITGSVTVPLLVILAPITGVLVALWYPAFPGLVPDVVELEEHLQPANAYVSVASNGGLIVGSAVGGLLVASFGAGVAISVDAVSFLIAGLLVFSFRQVSKPHDSGESVLGDLRDGWRLVISIRWFVVIILAFSVIVMALRGAEEVMGPVLALQEYGGASGWAFVLVCMSVGLLLGAFAGSKITFSRPMFYGMMITLALPLWLVCLAFALPLPIVAFGAFAWGVSIELFQVMWFTTIQTNIPRESIARVSSYDAMGSLMFGPIGLALAGPLVTSVGLQTAFLIAAAITFVAILGSLFFPSIRNLRAHQPQP
jgi:predicted MFS family arabinose efflux permease